MKQSKYRSTREELLFTMYKQIMNSVMVPTEHACSHDTEDKVVVAVK